MSKAETLAKLVSIEPIEPLHAQVICGWIPKEFEQAKEEAIERGLIRYAPVSNQWKTRLEKVK